MKKVILALGLLVTAIQLPTQAHYYNNDCCDGWANPIAWPFWVAGNVLTLGALSSCRCPEDSWCNCERPCTTCN